MKEDTAYLRQEQRGSTRDYPRNKLKKYNFRNFEKSVGQLENKFKELFNKSRTEKKKKRWKLEEKKISIQKVSKEKNERE